VAALASDPEAWAIGALTQQRAITGFGLVAAAGTALVAQITGNPILSGFLNVLQRVRLRVAWQGEWERTYRRIGTQSLRTPHSDQHQRIVDAIERDDADGASMKITEHLETIGVERSEAA
jgi:DNA-binding FadR family transcriptional regulator